MLTKPDEVIVSNVLVTFAETSSLPFATLFMITMPHTALKADQQMYVVSKYTKVRSEKACFKARHNKQTQLKSKTNSAAQNIMQYVMKNDLQTSLTPPPKFSITDIHSSKHIRQIQFIQWRTVCVNSTVIGCDFWFFHGVVGSN